MKTTGEIISTNTDKFFDLGLDSDDGEKIEFQGELSKCQKISNQLQESAIIESSEEESQDVVILRLAKEVSILKDQISSLRIEKANLLKSLAISNEAGNSSTKIRKISFYNKLRSSS